MGRRYLCGRLALNWSGGSREEEGVAGLMQDPKVGRRNWALQSVGPMARNLGGDIREEEDIAAIIKELGRRRSSSNSIYDPHFAV